MSAFSELINYEPRFMQSKSLTPVAPDFSELINVSSRCNQFATTAASCQDSHELRRRPQSKTNKSGKVPSSPVSATV